MIVNVLSKDLRGLLPPPRPTMLASSVLIVIDSSGLVMDSELPDKSATQVVGWRASPPVPTAMVRELMIGARSSLLGPFDKASGTVGKDESTLSSSVPRLLSGSSASLVARFPTSR